MWFNLTMLILKQITKALLTKADVIRIGATEGEWHRYVLANRCECARSSPRPPLY